MSYSQLIYKISLGLKSWGVFTLNVFFEQENWAPGVAVTSPRPRLKDGSSVFFPRADLIWEAGRRTGLGTVSLRARLCCSLGELEALGQLSGEPAFRWDKRAGISAQLGSCSGERWFGR